VSKIGVFSNFLFGFNFLTYVLRDNHLYLHVYESLNDSAYDFKKKIPCMTPLAANRTLNRTLNRTCRLPLTPIGQSQITFVQPGGKKF
jgi:hypothetical protein